MPVKLRYRIKKDGKKTYYLDIHHNGKRYRETIRVNIKNEKDKKIIAQKIRATREHEILSELYDINIHSSNTTTVWQYFDDYYRNCQTGNKSKAKLVLNKVKKFFNPQTPLSSVDQLDCENFRDYLVDNLKRLTAKTYFTTFKHILKEACIKRIIKQSPANNVKNVRTFQLLHKQVLTLDEARMLLNTPCKDKEIKRAFLFSYNTGLGYKDCKNLLWGQIQDGKILNVRSKTKTDNTIELNKSASKLLGARRNGKVFDLPNYNRFVSKYIKQWCEDAGINKHITFYCARHSFACNLLIYGADLFTVSKLLGHTNTTMTEKYLNYVNELRRKAVDNIPEL